MRCRRGGETFSRCVLIWVDKDFALARGLVPGLPEEARPDLDDAAGDGRAGGTAARARRRFGATLAANDRRLAEVTLTLTGPAETGGFVNALPMLHSRWMPAIDPRRPPRWTSW